VTPAGSSTEWDTSSHDHHNLTPPPYETSSSTRPSPPAYPIDFFPPSSPNSRDYGSLEDREPEYSDPYAASTHAKKQFRSYEKKPVIFASFDTSSYGTTRYRALDEESTTVGSAMSDTAFDGSENRYRNFSCFRTII